MGRLVSLPGLLRELQAPAIIDYFSLDVEGAETVVMNGFPWDTYRFKVLTVERPKPDLQDMLEYHGYKYLRHNSLWNDTTWVHKDLYDQVQAAWSNGASSGQPS